MRSVESQARAIQGLPVTVESVSRHYGTVKAVDDVSLAVKAGEFISLLGPSGSGKTTLLMMLAGFDEPTAGKLMVGDRDLTRVPANKRDIGMVFQKYALFPHMSVAQNIAYPLRMRGVSRAERDRKVQTTLAMVELPGYGERMPAQLSGGQQQRVALARAIVFDPPVILMDEPLGALDKKLRHNMQFEIKQLQERLGATVIYVTHDQEEALTMSDRIAVLNHGRLMQLGRPRDLYDQPENAFVADFIGEMNFIPGELTALDGESCRVAAGEVSVEARAAANMRAGDKVRIAVRPERTQVTRESKAGALPGRVVQLVFTGATLTVVVDLDCGPSIRASVGANSQSADLRPGEVVTVSWAHGDARAFSEVKR